MTENRQPARVVPASLVLAASLVGLEGVVLVLYGLTLVPNLHGDRITMGLTSLSFLVGYGGFIAYCAWRLLRLHSWARAPIVMAQLIQVPVGLSFWGGSTSVVCVVLVVVALAVLAGVFHPASLAALEEH